MQHLIKEFGSENLTLQVLDKNEKAIRFYKRFGFKVFGSEKNTFKKKAKKYEFTMLNMKREP